MRLEGLEQGIRRGSAESQEDWQDKISELINTVGIDAVEDYIERKKRNRDGQEEDFPENIH